MFKSSLFIREDKIYFAQIIGQDDVIRNVSGVKF